MLSIWHCNFSGCHCGFPAFLSTLCWINLYIKKVTLILKGSLSVHLNCSLHKNSASRICVFYFFFSNSHNFSGSEHDLQNPFLGIFKRFVSAGMSSSGPCDMRQKGWYWSFLYRKHSTPLLTQHSWICYIFLGEDKLYFTAVTNKGTWLHGFKSKRKPHFNSFLLFFWCVSFFWSVLSTSFSDVWVVTATGDPVLCHSNVKAVIAQPFLFKAWYNQA